MSKIIHFVYGSTSGHTEFVCKEIAAYMRKKKKMFTIQVTKVEQITKKELQNADIVVLASGTWNTGGIEGQVNPYMQRFMQNPDMSFVFNNMPMLAIGLGDERYFYTCAAANHLEEYITQHNGLMLLPSLRVINEPYDQISALHAWADTALKAITLLFKK